MKTLSIIVFFINLTNIILALISHNPTAFLGWFCAMVWFLIATEYEQREENI